LALLFSMAAGLLNNYGFSRLRILSLLFWQLLFTDALAAKINFFKNN